jgi:hypothetical protein
MFCKNCGNPVEDRATYCQACGSVIAPSEVHTQTSGTPRKPDEGIIENFFKPHGRLNRMRFIKRSFALAGLAFLCFFLLFAVLDDTEPFEVLSMVTAFVFQIANYCIAARRLEDMGHGPGAARLILIVGIVSLPIDDEHVLRILSYGQFTFWLYCAIKKGTAGKNQYGEDPLQQGASS